MYKNGFTLLEMLIVVVIIGILATLGFTHYGGYREKTLDREAQSNLLLILAGERIARMESNTNVYAGPAVSNSAVNTLLKITLPVTNPGWNYTIAVPTGATFCAQATRNVTGGRSFHIFDPTTAATSDPPVISGTCP